MDGQVVALICLGVLAVALVVVIVFFALGVNTRLATAATSAAAALSRAARSFVHFGYAAGRGVVEFAQAAEGLFTTALRQLIAGFAALPDLVVQAFGAALGLIRGALQQALDQIRSALVLMLNEMQSAATGLLVNWVEVGDRVIRQASAFFTGLFPFLVRTAIQAAIGIYGSIVDAGLLVFAGLQQVGLTVFQGLLDALNVAEATSAQVFNTVFGPLRDAVAAMCDVVGCSV